MGKPIKTVGKVVRKAGEVVGLGGDNATPPPPPALPPEAQASATSASDPRIAAAILAERMRGGMGQGRKSTFRDATYQTPTAAEVTSTLAAVPQPANRDDAFAEIRRRMARVPGLRGGK